jgi:hypothetical protein
MFNLLLPFNNIVDFTGVKTQQLSTSTPDFSSSYISVQFPPLWIIVLVIIVLIVLSVIAARAASDIFAGFVTFTLGGIVFIPILILFNMMLVTEQPEEKNKVLRSWVQEKYLIDITTEQADYLLTHQIELPNIPNSDNKATPILVENAYGNIVGITLVKKDKEWVIYQQEDTGRQTENEKK